MKSRNSRPNQRYPQVDGRQNAVQHSWINPNLFNFQFGAPNVAFPATPYPSSFGAAIRPPNDPFGMSTPAFGPAYSSGYGGNPRLPFGSQFEDPAYMAREMSINASLAMLNALSDNQHGPIDFYQCMNHDLRLEPPYTLKIYDDSDVFPDTYSNAAYDTLPSSSKGRKRPTNDSSGVPPHGSKRLRWDDKSSKNSSSSFPPPKSHTSSTNAIPAKKQVVVREHYQSSSSSSRSSNLVHINPNNIPVSRAPAINVKPVKNYVLVTPEFRFDSVSPPENDPLRLMSPPRGSKDSRKSSNLAHTKSNDGVPESRGSSVNPAKKFVLITPDICLTPPSRLEDDPLRPRKSFKLPIITADDVLAPYASKPTKSYALVTPDFSQNSFPLSKPLKLFKRSASSVLASQNASGNAIPVQNNSPSERHQTVSSSSKTLKPSSSHAREASSHSSKQVAPASNKKPSRWEDSAFYDLFHSPPPPPLLPSTVSQLDHDFYSVQASISDISGSFSPTVAPIKSGYESPEDEDEEEIVDKGSPVGSPVGSVCDENEEIVRFDEIPFYLADDYF